MACGLESVGSVVVAHRTSCSTACEIFPDQTLKLCPCIGRWILPCATREFCQALLLLRKFWSYVFWSIEDCYSFCIFIISVQSLSRVYLIVTPWTAASQASMSITNSQSLFKLISIELVMPSNHLILCCPLLLLPSIFPSIRVFSMSQFFTSGGQNIGVSASESVHPMNIQDWFLLGLSGWISLQSKGLSRVFSNTTVQKPQFFGTQRFFMIQILHPYMTTGKTITLTRWTFVSKVMSLLFIMPSKLVIVFLPRSKHLLISWLQSPSAVILVKITKRIKFLTVSTVIPTICHKVMGLMPWS